MEESNKNVLTYIGAGVIVLLLIGLLFAVSSNSKNKKSLNSEKLASEKLLSEKLTAEKELMKLKADFSNLEAKNAANNKLLEETNTKIAASQLRINSLSSENRSLRAATHELEELKMAKTELEKQSAQLKSEYDMLMAKSKELENSISLLEAEKKDLAMKLDKVLMYSSDNFLVTATRGKTTEKMVVCARRTKKLNMTFEVPKSLTEVISFKIVTPAGTTITPDDKALSWNVYQDSRKLTASLSAMTGEFEESRQVALTYTANQKLLTGEYKIQILCNGNTIGNCRVKLK